MQQPLFQTDHIFASLVTEITKSIDENVIITNENGTIVASTVYSRIGEYHEGAYLAMRKQQNMTMTKEHTLELKGVKKGIVLPIIIEGNPIGVVGITGDPKKINPYGRIVQKMAELFIKETMDQVTQETMARNLELFVSDWMEGTISKELLIERSHFFNIDITKYSQIICLSIPLTTNHLSYKDILMLRNLWDQRKDAIFVRWGQDKLIIIDKEHASDQLLIKLTTFLKGAEFQLGSDIHVGIGQPKSYMKLATSFEQAKRACIIAKKENRIVFEEELQFEMIQYEINRDIKMKFIKRTISPLLEDEALYKTLSSWLKNNMSIRETSQDLHIHKNTLYYRIEKIKQITDLNPSHIDHIVLFYIGIRFMEELND